MKKVLFIGLLVVGMLLSGCQNNIPAQPTEPTEPKAFEEKESAQNQYLLTTAASFQETDGFFCGTNLAGSYLQYYDKASGIHGVLCADPSCTHDSEECSAYVQAGATLSCYDDSLYWIAKDGTSTEKAGKVFLWKSDLSGMNREKTMSISFEDVIEPYQPQRYVIHQGKLYLLGHASVVDGTQTGYRVSLLCRPLSGKEDFTVLYDEVFFCGSQETVRFVGDSVYLSVVTFSEDGSYDLAVTEFHVQTGASETVYQETGMTEIPGAIWVTEEHEIYLPGAAENTAYLWMLENNERTQRISRSTEYASVPEVMNGIAVFFSQEADTRLVEICDLTGQTIYSGKLFPAQITGLDQDPNTCALAVLGGDSEKMIVNLSCFAETGLSDYTVLIDLKNNLDATVLWRSVS